MNRCMGIAGSRAQRLIKSADDSIVPIVADAASCTKCVRFALDLLAAYDHLWVVRQYPVMDFLELRHGQLVWDTVLL